MKLLLNIFLIITFSFQLFSQSINEELFKKAEQYYKGRVYNKAITIYETILEEKNFKHRQAMLFRLGHSYYYLHKYEKSYQILTKLLEEFPKTSYLKTSLGMMINYFKEKNDLKTAIKMLKEYSEKYKNDIEIKRMILGVYESKGEYNKALKLLEKDFPRDLWFITKKVGYLRELKKYTEAIEFIKTNFPRFDRPEMYQLLADLYELKKDFDNSVLWYETLYKKTKKIGYLINKARMLLSNNLLGKGKVVINRIIKTLGHNINTYRQIAEIYKEFGLYDELLELYNEGIRRGYDFQKEKINVYEVMGKYELAIYSYLQILDKSNYSYVLIKLINLSVYEEQSDLVEKLLIKYEDKFPEKKELIVMLQMQIYLKFKQLAKLIDVLKTKYFPDIHGSRESFKGEIIISINPKRSFIGKTLTNSLTSYQEQISLRFISPSVEEIDVTSLKFALQYKKNTVDDDFSNFKLYNDIGIIGTLDKNDLLLGNIIFKPDNKIVIFSNISGLAVQIKKTKNLLMTFSHPAVSSGKGIKNIIPTAFILKKMDYSFLEGIINSLFSIESYEYIIDIYKLVPGQARKKINPIIKLRYAQSLYLFNEYELSLKILNTLEQKVLKDTVNYYKALNSAKLKRYDATLQHLKGLSSYEAFELHFKILILQGKIKDAKNILSGEIKKKKLQRGNLAYNEIIIDLFLNEYVIMVQDIKKFLEVYPQFNEANDLALMLFLMENDFIKNKDEIKSAVMGFFKSYYLENFNQAANIFKGLSFRTDNLDSIIKYYLAKCYMYENDYDKAIKELNIITGKKTFVRPYALELLGWIYMHKKNNSLTAKKYFKQILANYPSFVNVNNIRKILAH